MPENKHLRLLVLLYIALGALGLWLTARFLVPWLLPFLIAWALAALLEPPVRLCMDGLHLPRWAAAALCTLLLTALILGLLFLGAWRVENLRRVKNNGTGHDEIFLYFGSNGFLFTKIHRLP